MHLVFNKVVVDPLKFQRELQKVSVPPNLFHMSDTPATEDDCTSTFNPVMPGSQQE